MNRELLLGIFLLALAGCNPFGARESQTSEFIAKTDATAHRIAQGYKADIREVKPYQIYQYQNELTDPFRLRQFLLQMQKKKEQEQQKVAKRKENVCLPPQCVPPIPHEPQLLEGYGLKELQFVGTLGSDNDIALIKTPNYGVVTVRKGDYVGKNNGRIQAINESSIVLQEKLKKNGLWENKKTILMIAR